jgi:hypothetical protein
VHFRLAEAQPDPKRPVVVVVLYDIVEDDSARRADVDDIRDDNGRVIARQGAPRRFALSYLVSIVAADVALEHQLLGRVLAAGVDTECLPAHALPANLVEHGLSVPLQVAKARSLGGHAAALLPAVIETLARAQGWRTTLELSLVVPILPSPITEIERPAEILDLGVSQDPTSSGSTANGSPLDTAVSRTGRADPLQDRRWTSVRRREPGGSA